MAKPKARMSFTQCRKAMLEQISAIQKEDIPKITIPFQNDDVPNFLNELDRFEKESLKTCLVVK